MDENKARAGLKATEGLHEQFTKLLELLGHGNLLYDPKSDGNPSKVPDKCEETNKNVEEVLKNMKTLLKDIRIGQVTSRTNLVVDVLSRRSSRV